MVKKLRKFWKILKEYWGAALLIGSLFGAIYFLFRYFKSG